MQLAATDQDQKNGPETAQKTGRALHGDRERAPTRALPKTHVGYWRPRVERRTYEYGGRRSEVPEYSVRMEYGGFRRRLTLGTALKEEAATKARDIYLSLLANGWSATLAELAPKTANETVKSDIGPSVGEFLIEVERTANLKPRTFRRYAQYFRMLAAHVQRVERDASRYDYRNGGLEVWRGHVDAVPLSAITPAAVADWKVDYLKRAGGDPRRQLEVNRSFNAALRHCKSLFSSRIINKANFAVKIPRFKVADGQHGEREAYWFETLDFQRAGSMKFQSPPGVTYEALVRHARDELRSQAPEAYKLFLLCLCAGLRRAEADVCLWAQLSPGDDSIRIESNEFIDPKHGSGGTVYVDASLMNELLSFKGETQEGFVVNSPWEWKPTAYWRYRCEPHWRTLMNWLEEHGIKARKKVHELRKLFGDAIVKQKGIFAGSAQLRHATIQMTASHYADPRQRAVLPVANLFQKEAKAGSPRNPSRSRRSDTRIPVGIEREGVSNGV